MKTYLACQGVTSGDKGGLEGAVCSFLLATWLIGACFVALGRFTGGCQRSPACDVILVDCPFVAGALLHGNSVVAVSMYWALPLKFRWWCFHRVFSPCVFCVLPCVTSTFTVSKLARIIKQARLGRGGGGVAKLFITTYHFFMFISNATFTNTTVFSYKCMYWYISTFGYFHSCTLIFFLSSHLVFKFLFFPFLTIGYDHL